ncbi:GNAT family N-acetyltransferase [Streptococcus saliviloxodontae]|uniref:Ribosomal protein S18 acetylase RimI-like enzyme n=1 Tax=Streptococcus saliviloxodontae TaxID=1349416 RepID=A0ABS2PL46_9STRE|nr:GNAT family N-acetyltransferase [Streptococcus saliviloxodontae]MBM7636086.1 ribosomal protein S18 acetylase RimI-like enzyme [Streptococcus saliviloxodontae]
MTIRQADKSDIPRLQELLLQILQVHHDVRPDLFRSEGSKFTDQELVELIDNPKTPIFVYLDQDGNILGHLFTIIKEITEETGALVQRKTLFIDDLCVDERARGQKIGEKLYQYALKYAEEIDCYNVTLTVWNANESALRFYQRLGLEAQHTTMEHIIK